MPKFRKKPVVIEAWQYSATATIPRGVCHGLLYCDSDDARPHLHTMHDNQRVDLVDGDWIIPEPDGVHFYPCKPDVFAATYEPVE